MSVNAIQIQNMPISEKLQLLELLTDSLAQQQGQVYSPSWHQNELESRAQELSEPESWYSLEQIKSHYRR